MIKKARHKGSKAAIVQFLIAALFFLTLFSGCKSEWDQEATNKVTLACIRGCTEVNDPNPILFCECIVPKIKDKYKNIAEADSLIKKPVLIAEFGADCRVATNEAKAEWTEQSKKSFLQSCADMAKRDGITQTDYCDCILAKVQKRYVTNTRMEGVKLDRMRAIGKECIDGE